MTAYPVAGKRKSFDICLAFIRGCHGQIGTEYRGGPAFFYGIDDSNVDIWNKVRSNGDTFWYCDNSYFDSARQHHFRVTKNRLQHTGAGVSDGARFRKLGIQIKPWRRTGETIVVCPQSDSFMRTVAGYQGNWTQDTMKWVLAASQRPVVLRNWSANKSALAASLQDDLATAHALVTWSSAAAVTALLEGVPVIVGATDCAAKIMSSDAGIESLVMPERENWAGVLSDNEWNLDEMRSGLAWSHLQA